jgi:hypothetical protein
VLDVSVCLVECFTFTHRFFLRNMALSHALGASQCATPSGWDGTVTRQLVREFSDSHWPVARSGSPRCVLPINMTDQNRASASRNSVSSFIVRSIGPDALARSNPFDPVH